MEQYHSEIYKSQEGRHLLHNLYRKHMIALNVPIRERMVETSFGDTHIVFYGNPSGKPVLAFYGESFINPLAIRPLTTLLDLEKIQLIVPDPVGQIGFSAERELSFSKNEYSKWASQVMDALALEIVSVVGYSFGGNIALQLCADFSLRIERLLLFMPGGIATASSSKIAKLTKPASFKNEKAITDEAVKKALKSILTFQQDELIEAVKMMFLHAQINKNQFSDIKKKHLQKFRSPVYLVTEKSDELFPGEEIQKRAKKIFHRIDGSQILRLGCHCGLFENKKDETLKDVNVTINDFLLRTP